MNKREEFCKFYNEGCPKSVALTWELLDYLIYGYYGEDADYIINTYPWEAIKANINER